GLAGVSGFLVCLLTLAGASLAQSSPPPSAAPAAPPASTSAQTPAAAPAQGTPAQEDDSGGGFVFKKEIEEVVLHATVVDNQNHLITGLTRDKFEVFEDEKRQDLTSFHKERVPDALGILIDNSASMLPRREKLK